MDTRNISGVARAFISVSWGHGVLASKGGQSKCESEEKAQSLLTRSEVAKLLRHRHVLSGRTTSLPFLLRGKETLLIAMNTIVDLVAVAVGTLDVVGAGHGAFGEVTESEEDKGRACETHE